MAELNYTPIKIPCLTCGKLTSNRVDIGLDDPTAEDENGNSYKLLTPICDDCLALSPKQKGDNYEYF
jgi:hypothetical protein